MSLSIQPTIRLRRCSTPSKKSGQIQVLIQGF